MDESSESSRITSITNAALHLFAAFGYDGTSVDMIADAAGVDHDEVMAAGGRRGLYIHVLEQFFQEQSALLEEVAHDFTPSPESLRNFLDRFLELYLENPYSVAVWQHRRLGDAFDMKDLEERYRTPVFRRAVEIVGPDVFRNPDYAMISAVINWCIHGFVQGGIPRSEGPPARADSVEGRTEFRAYLHRLQELLLQGGLLRDATSPDTPREAAPVPRPDGH